MSTKIQLIEKQVNEASEIVRLSDDLDSRYDQLTGIAFMDNMGLNCELVSSSLEGKEIFPKDFEVVFLQSNVFVPPNDRFFTLNNKKAKGNKIEIDFKDGGTAPIYPYTLKMYLRLEKNDAKN